MHHARLFLAGLALLFMSSPLAVAVASDGAAAAIDLPAMAAERALPDACGRMNTIGASGAAALAAPTVAAGQTAAGLLPDPIVVYPGWPIAASGQNNRGGIYCNLDADPALEVVYTVSSQVHAWNIDGSPVSGWPRTTTGASDGAAAYGDVDGDGIGEIVVSTRIGTGGSGMLYVFEADGTIVSPFPIALHGGATKTPALGNVDEDPALEIVVEERAYPSGYVCAYNGDGSIVPGWPQQLDYVPASSVAIGDITGDGVPEIVGESYYQVYAWDRTGNLLPGFPFAPGTGRVFSYSSPVLADLDGDGAREIVCGDHSINVGDGRVHVLRSDGTPLPGWPRPTVYWIYGPPAVGDIDGDGEPDVAIGDQVLATSPVNQVYAWDASGTPLPGFPIVSLWAVNTQILLADLDGDDMVELMFDDNTSNNRYIGYNHDGTPMTDGWPLPVQGTTFFINPFAVDIDGDGELDLSGGGTESSVCRLYLWDANVAVNEAKNELTILQYNPQHDGVYGPGGSTGVAEPELSDLARRVTLAVGPSPFSSATSLSVSAPRQRLVDLAVYAVSGRLVRSWSLLAPDAAVTWDGRDSGGRAMAAGVYLCVARTAGETVTQRVVLAR